MIPNKFLCYKTEAGFLDELGKGLISDNSVVMVLEGPFFYTHGKRFYCAITPESFDLLEYTLASSVTELSNRIDENERTIAKALNDIKTSGGGTSDIENQIPTNLKERLESLEEQIEELIRIVKPG